jgi:hypothetical protein
VAEVSNKLQRIIGELEKNRDYLEEGIKESIG